MPDTEELLPDAEPEIHDDVATKHKLKGLVDSFPGFDGDMREGTRQRREKEQAKVTAMRMEMSRLEAALTEQTQLRAEMNETIQKYCDEQLVKMTEQFESLLEHQTTRALERLDTLNTRIDELDTHFATEKKRILKEIEEESERLSKLLDEFQAAFEQEKKSRLEREAKITAQMEQHEQDVAVKFSEELAARETKIAELRAEGELDRENRATSTSSASRRSWSSCRSSSTPSAGRARTRTTRPPPRPGYVCVHGVINSARCALIPQSARYTGTGEYTAVVRAL